MLPKINGQYLGEIRSSKSLGYKSRIRVIWTFCNECHIARWVQLIHGKPRYNRCLKCRTKIIRGFKSIIAGTSTVLVSIKINRGLRVVANGIATVGSVLTTAGQAVGEAISAIWRILR